MTHRLFDRAWFNRHQRGLLWFCNTPLLRIWFRWVMRLHWDVSDSTPIVEIGPNYVTTSHPTAQYEATFLTGPLYAKRLYRAFKPLWWAMHAWDWLIADRWVPEWSFGFSVLTQEPSPGSPGAVTVDGDVKYESGIINGGATTWSTMHDATTGSSVDDTGAFNYAFAIISSAGGAPWWGDLFRGFVGFDTSSLGQFSIIDTETLYLMGHSQAKTGTTDLYVNIYSANPHHPTFLATNDYGRVGSLPFSIPILYDDWLLNKYNVFPINLDGRLATSLTGITFFSTREAAYDAPNIEPPQSITNIYCRFVSADEVSGHPKLVIAYNVVPPPGTGDFEMREFERLPHRKTIIPITPVDVNGYLVTGLTGVDSEIAVYLDGDTTIPAFADCLNEIVETGVSGKYSLVLEASEVPVGYIRGQVKSNEARTFEFLVNTTTRDALRALRNRVVLDPVGLTLTVYEEDDVTVAWSGPITLGARNAVNSVDPT